MPAEVVPGAGVDAAACPPPDSDATSSPRGGRGGLRRARAARSPAVRAAHVRAGGRVRRGKQDIAMATVVACGPGGGRAGLDAGDRAEGGGRRTRRRARPDPRLPGRRAPAQPAAASAWRVRRRGRLAAEAVPARADRGRRRSRAGRLAGLGAHRRVGRQAAAAWSTRGGPRRAGQADDQRRSRRHQGRLRARRRAGQRCPGGARLARDRGRSAGDRRGCQDARGKQPAGGARRAAPPQAADRA